MTYRGERRRQSSEVMQQFQQRARQILDEIEPQVRGQADLERQLAAARTEIETGSVSEPGRR